MRLHNCFFSLLKIDRFRKLTSWRLKKTAISLKHQIGGQTAVTAHSFSCSFADVLDACYKLEVFFLLMNLISMRFENKI
jgi:hypothetical protein